MSDSMPRGGKGSGTQQIETIGNEELLRYAFENANDGVCIVSLDGHLLKVNQRMTDIFGYSAEEMESMTVNDIALPEDRDISPTFIRKSICGEITSAIFEKRYFAKGGQVIHGQVSTSLIRDRTGDPACYISHVQDITKRKQAEAERDCLVEKLKKALSEIRMLKGILPFCCFCKKIRDDKGYWEKVDVYIRKHSAADISHSICPACAKENYPEEYAELYPDKHE